MLLPLALAGLVGLAWGKLEYPGHGIEQPINHFPNSPRYKQPTNETFRQRYFFESKFYKPGGPVFLYIGGETSGPSRFEFLQDGIIHMLMRHTNGLGVILENRYYGQSWPFPNSTTDNLEFLTTEQTIADNDNFARNAKFPGVDADLTAPNTPWIVYGGSLAGAQTAFTLKTYPQTFWGGIASSGVIHAVLGYSQWYAPIQKYAPQDCIASINQFVDKMDALIATGNQQAITELKTIFGLEALENIGDFAMTIAFPIGGPMFYPTDTWQELNWDPAAASNDFWYFCHNVTNLEAPASVTDVDMALAKYSNGEPWTNLGNYAKYVKDVVLPICGDGLYNEPHCFGKHNQSYWARTFNNEDRSYLYTSCTEQGAYQVAPAHGPSLISRVLDVDYTQQWCTWAFPPGKYNSIPATPDLDRYNKYGGLDFSAERLAFIDGSIDPWLDVCYHSTDAPPRYYSEDNPELLIAGSGHHWDSYGVGNMSAEPVFIQQAQRFEIRVVKRWLKQFAAMHNKREL